jgi:hypothetical protein
MAKSRTILNRCRLTNLPADYFQVWTPTTSQKNSVPSAQPIS